MPDIADAQSDPDTLIRTLEPIEIRATRSTLTESEAPISLRLLSFDAEDLNRRASITLEDLSYKMPGIWINDRENFSLGERITIRGLGWRAAFGVRGIQVVLDGIPLTVADGQSVINIVDPAFLRRIELIRGPASTFWGNSSGGVLYLSTIPQRSQGSTVRLKGTTGSYGLGKGEAQYTYGNGGFMLNSYLSYHREDGYRDHSEVNIARFGVNGRAQLGDKNTFQFMGAYANMPEAEHPSSLTRQQFEEDPTQANSGFQSVDAGKTMEQGQLGLSWLNENSLGLFTATVYGLFRDLENPLPFAIINVDRLAGGSRLTLQNQFGKLKVNAGVAAKVQDDDRIEYANDNGSPGAVQVNQVETVTNYSAFASASYSMGRWDLMGGLRYDWHRFRTDANTAVNSGERTFNALSPTFGLNYHYDGGKIFTNISTAFESPTTTELVNRPGGGNGFNPGIDHENTLGVELGASGAVGKRPFSYDIAFYHMWIRDLLFPFQLTANGPTFFRNQGETRHRGVELSFSYQPNSHLEFGSIYNFLNAEFHEATTIDSIALDGNRVPGVADHRITGYVTYAPSAFSATVDFKFIDGYPVNNLNTAHTKPYAVLNTHFSYRWQASSGLILTPFLAVNNLLDKRYPGSVVINAFGGRYYEPAADLNWKAGVSIQIQ
ncbi:MAG: TonB-dependent receptor [Balneolaceae bacterium]|nr:TonB-dependent receptor [Balneolaceae bacterium]